MDVAALPVAHAGHWALYALYGVPVAVVLASVCVRAARRCRPRGLNRSPAP